MKSNSSVFLSLLESYLYNYLPISKGLTESTIITYKSVFRLFLEYLYTKHKISPTNITFEALNVDVLSGFLDWIEQERGCSVSTRNHRLSVLVSFSEYACNRNFEAAVIFGQNLSKIPRKKGCNKKRSIFTRQEVQILLSLPNTNNSIGIRDRTLLSFMYASGVRAQEVCDMTVGDIRFENTNATVSILGKGRKIRMISIPEKASKILRKYIEYRHISTKYDRHVFSSQTHEKMTVSCVEEIFAKYITLARINHPDLFREDSYPPHSMRHTTATHMLESGVPLIVVKNFLGHKSLQTTQIYAEISMDTVNKQLLEWNSKWFVKDMRETQDVQSDIPSFLK